MKKILIFALALLVAQAKSMETTSFTSAHVFGGSLGVGLVGLGVHCYDRLNHANAIKEYNEKVAPIQKKNEKFGDKIRYQNHHGHIQVSKGNEKQLREICKNYDMAKPSRAYVGPRVGIQGSVGWSAQVMAEDRKIMYLPKEPIIEDGFQVNKMMKAVVMEKESNEWEATFQESFLNELESQLSSDSKDKIEKDSPGWKKMYPYCVSLQEVYCPLDNTAIYFKEQELPEMPQYAPLLKHPKKFFSAWFAITSGIALYWIKSKK
ncbi:MAG TPA: hypothetical protein VHO47_02990 [Candidatus Babeliales bacterium]|nr:hypothetical protein [Candidatus Babeliales bacterium]